MDIQQQTEEVEKELLATIVRYLRQHQIDVPTASKLSREFLAALPMKNQQDLLEKLKELSTHYEPVKLVYQHEFAKDERVREQQALSQMQHAIRQGNIEHAITVAKSLKEGA